MFSIHSQNLNLKLNLYEKKEIYYEGVDWTNWNCWGSKLSLNFV